MENMRTKNHDGTMRMRRGWCEMDDEYGYKIQRGRDA